MLTRIAAAFVACGLLTITTLVSQSADPCVDKDLKRAWESGTDPVYADAMELTRMLKDHGLVVECVRSSKQAQLVEGQKGAAWFKTRQGVFEVWFLPKDRTFKNLRIVADSKPESRYSYSFEGSPHISTAMDSAKPIIFIQHENLLFEILDHEELAKHLRLALEIP
jgi:hypothetical protein